MIYPVMLDHANCPAKARRAAIGGAILLGDRLAVEIGTAMWAPFWCAPWRHAASLPTARRLAMSLLTRRILSAAAFRIAGVH